MEIEEFLLDRIVQIDPGFDQKVLLEQEDVAGVGSGRLVGSVVLPARHDVSQHLLPAEAALSRARHLVYGVSFGAFQQTDFSLDDFENFGRRGSSVEFDAFGNNFRLVKSSWLICIQVCYGPTASWTN